MHIARKLISLLTAVSLLSSSVDAWSAAGQMNLSLAEAKAASLIHPLELKGLKVYLDNPFRIDFIVNKGSQSMAGEQFNAEGRQLIRYFLASLTVPEADFWVNLSPFEKGRIVPEAFGRTEMGRDLLAEDYLLKQITAAVLHPDGETGKRVWGEIYARVKARYGTKDIPLDMFNKVWIVPAKAVVYSNPKTATAYVIEQRLKVMLESDYLALEQSGQKAEEALQQPGKEVVREVVIPVLEREINEGQGFVKLRQVYGALILANWYRKTVRESLLGQAYVGQRKTAGINIADPAEPEKIWGRYVETFKKGAFDLIREEADSESGEVIPRRYFAGGMLLTDKAMSSAVSYVDGFQKVPLSERGALAVLQQEFKIIPSDRAMTAGLKPEQIQAAYPGFERFKGWLHDISEDALEQEINLLTMRDHMLQLFRAPVEDKNETVSQALVVMMKKGVIPKEEILSQGGVLKFTLDHLGAGTLLRQRDHLDFIKAVFSSQELFRDEKLKLLKEWQMVDKLFLYFSRSASPELYEYSLDIVEMLVGMDLLDREEINKDGGVLSVLLANLQRNVNRTSRYRSVSVLEYLQKRGLATKEEIIQLIKEKEILLFLRTDMMHQSLALLKANSAALGALVTAGFVSKKEASALVKQTEIMDSLQDISLGYTGDDRLKAVYMLDDLVSASLVTRQDMLGRDGLFNTLFRLFLDDKSIEVVEAAVKMMGKLLGQGVISRDEVRQKLKQERVLEKFNDELGRSKRLDHQGILAAGAAIGALALEGVIEKNDVLGEQGLLASLMAMMGHDEMSAVWDGAIWPVSAMVMKGVIGKEEITKEPGILDVLLKGIHPKRSIITRENSIKALEYLIRNDMISGQAWMRSTLFSENVIGGLLREGMEDQQEMLAGLLKAMVDKRLIEGDLFHQFIEQDIEQAALQALAGPHRFGLVPRSAHALSAMVKQGLLNQGDVQRSVREKGVAAKLLAEFQQEDADTYVVESRRVLVNLLEGDLLERKREFSPAALSAVLQGALGAEVSADARTSYLRVVQLLKGDAWLAARMAFWSPGELQELLSFLDSYAGAFAQDRWAEGRLESQRRSLMLEIIKEYQSLINSPQLLLSALKKRVRQTIGEIGPKIAIKIHEPAAIYAARALIKAIGIPKKNVDIIHVNNGEIELSVLKDAFAGYKVYLWQDYAEPGVVVAEFHDGERMALTRNSINFTAFVGYAPYKYGLPEKDTEAVARIRAGLNIGARQVIVLGSPEEGEFEEFMDVFDREYARVEPAKRPLVIAAFRNRQDEKHLRSLPGLEGRDIKVRSDVAAPWPDVSRAEVLVLNTAGELFKMYGLADMAVVGEDRNIAEPLSQGVPVLFFDGAWRNNYQIKNMMSDVGAALPFNGNNFERLFLHRQGLDEMTGAASVLMQKIDHQIEMGAMGFSLDIMGLVPEYREKFLSLSVKKDSAQKMPDTGGIDLTSSKLDSQINVNGEEVRFHIDPAHLQRLQESAGLSPVIIAVQPLEDPEAFLTK